MPKGAGGGRKGELHPALSLEQERQRTIDTLSQHFALDNLSMDELERRLEQVYRATSLVALRDLTKDLPTEAAEPAERSVAPLPEAFAPEHERIVSIMADTKRRGVWRAPKRLDVWCIMSDTKLDLTQAELTSGVTEIHLRAVMAAVKVIVRPGVRVVLQPKAFMSSVVDDMADQPPVGSGAPVIRITGPAIMSELKVSVRVRELTE